MANWNAMDDLIKGNDLNLYLVNLSDGSGHTSAMTESMVSDAKVVAYATSCSFEITADSLDVTSKLSCRWQQNLPGVASYNVSSDALYCLQANAAAMNAYTIDDLFKCMLDGDNIGWVMAKDSSEDCGTVAGPDTTGVCYWGEASIANLSISAGNNEIATSSIQLNGSGEPHRYGLN